MDHECEGCKNGLDAIRTKELEAMKKCGWYAHFVTQDSESPTGFNVHTHGFRETFNDHPDIQIVFPLPFDVAHGLLWNIADRLKNGERFEAKKSYEKIAGNGYNVTFIRAQENGREVLRLIVPNKDGSLTKNKMSGVFREQWS
jgi:hypothetical protein